MTTKIIRLADPKLPRPWKNRTISKERWNAEWSLTLSLGSEFGPLEQAVLSPGDAVCLSYAWSVCLMPDSTLLSWQRPCLMLVSDQLPCYSRAPTVQGRLGVPPPGSLPFSRPLWVRPHPCSLLCGFTLCPCLSTCSASKGSKLNTVSIPTCRRPSCQWELAYHVLGRNGRLCECWVSTHSFLTA